MNSYERIMRTIKGEATDRTPVGGVLCMYGARLTGCNLEKYYTDPKCYLEGQAAVVETFEPDFLVSPLCVAHEAKAFGCEIHYFSNNPPNITRRAIQGASEIKNLKFPNIDEDPGLLFIRESIRRMAAQYRGQVPIGAVWMDPLDMLSNALGPETFMELMIFNKQAFDDIMIQMTEFCIKYGNAMLNDGADLLINFGSLCNVAMITRDLAQQVAYPLLEESYTQINGGILLHAGGYKIGPYLDIYASLPNLLGFIIDSRDSLKTARQMIKKEQIVAGNIEGPTMDTWTPEQIGKICRYMLEQMKDDPHYILSSSAADIPYGTTQEQIKALMRAPRDFKERG